MLYLPAWIYDASPYVYVCAGCLALLGLDNNLGRFCGLLLIAVAGIIIRLRMGIRRHSREMREHIVAQQRSVTFQYKND
jgi:hypothetical protein